RDRSASRESRGDLHGARPARRVRAVAQRDTQRGHSENLGRASMTPGTALDMRWTAVKAGLSRGWIETRQNFTETSTLMVHVFPTLMYLLVLLVLRKNTLPGTHFSVSMLLLPGFLCLPIIMGGLCGPTGGITAD